MPGPEGKTVTVSIRVSPERRNELQRIAKTERRTVSQIVNFMIEESLKTWQPSPPRHERRRKGES